jgi:cellulose biosynthesis protein BcsQ
MILSGVSVPFVAIGNGRGGGGKTTITNSLAAHLLARADGLRVALLDLDGQASASTYLGARAVADPLAEPPVMMHGIRLYQGGQALHSASAREMAAHIRRASVGVDIVLADLPPALAHPTHAAILGVPNARLLIVPQLEPGAVQPAQRLAAMARQAAVPFWVLGNRADRRRSITAAVAMGLEGIFADEMIPLVLPDASVDMECILARKPLPQYRPKSALSRSLAVVADMLLTGGPR